jgi:hypothetical protein
MSWKLSEISYMKMSINQRDGVPEELLAPLVVQE